MKIGIISDTHGRLSDKCKDIFKQVDVIFHAGDIGSLSVIEELEQIAPVYAVCGNMDFGEIAKKYPRTDLIEINNLYFFLMHEPFRLNIDPKAAGVNCVIFGHTHIPEVQEKDGIFYINPGSASLPKWGRNPTVALCDIKGRDIKVDIVEL